MERRGAWRASCLTVHTGVWRRPGLESVGVEQCIRKRSVHTGVWGGGLFGVLWDGAHECRVWAL